MANDAGALNAVLPGTAAPPDIVMAGRLETTMPDDGTLLVQAGAVTDDDDCGLAIDRAAGEGTEGEIEGDDNCGGRNCGDAGAERSVLLCGGGDENTLRVPDPAVSEEPTAPEESRDGPGDE